ncbi:MAG: Type 1 glutamine amidotransferase-like domain-containing protein [Clostridia bacterium]|nr:Type 1 glutamine amidotransferase-like domain-containing protein [Clostridia bacterium]
MGNVIAIGGGFSGKDFFPLARDIIRLTGKEKPNYLFIPSTAYDTLDRFGVAVFSKYGLKTDVLYLTHAYMTEEILAEKIRNADIIHVPGGNLQFATDLWRETHADFYLREAFREGKTFFGSSSGSMCWFRKGYDDCGPEDSFRFVDGLDLLPYCNVPHYETEFWQEYNRHAREAGISTIACENETAICFLDGKWSVRVSPARPDARVWFFDKERNYERIDLTAHPEILEKL